MPKQHTKYLVDTNSLSNAFRYYTALDNSDELKSWIAAQFASGKWLLLKEVLKECGKGLVGKPGGYEFLKQIKLHPSVGIPEPKIASRIDANWVARKFPAVGSQKYNMNKDREYKMADFQLILAAMRDRDKLAIITEETTAWNGKLFKKIPTICEIEGIECISLPEYLAQHGATITFNGLP